MLYIQKENCPVNIQSQINTRINTEEWDSIPEIPSSDQVKLVRKEYFDKLEKHSIREALISEQHGLCAYCMCRIENSGESTTIEHLVPLSKSKSGAMDYKNWLAVCKGGQNIEPPQKEKRVICCDVKKDDKVTTLSPLNQSQMDKIAYFDDGTVFYNCPVGNENDTITHEINYTFGLNGKVDPKTGRSRKDTSTGIVKSRRDAYIAMRDLLTELNDSGTLTSDIIQRYRHSLLSDKVWEPFIGVKLYVLKMFPNV